MKFNQVKHCFMVLMLVIIPSVLISSTDDLTSQNSNIINWVLDDPTVENGWEFSELWQQNKDQLSQVNNNIIVNDKVFHNRKISLQLAMEHHQNGYNGCAVFTRSDNSGLPPVTAQDAHQGKDISQCDMLEFRVKAAGKTKMKNFKIQLKDIHGKNTDKLFLTDYLIPGAKWQLVRIPLNDFSWVAGINRKVIRSVNFFVEPDDPPGKYVFYLNQIRFLRTGVKKSARFKLVYNDNSLQDGAWNFSGAVVGNGTRIMTSAYHKNLMSSFREKYKGSSCLKIVLKQIRFGWGFFWFSGSSDGSGVPPSDWNDYNTPKDISVYNAIQLWIKGQGRCYAKIEMTDTDNKNTGKIELMTDPVLPDKWTRIIIPFIDIPWDYFNTQKFKDIKFIFDDTHPPGEVTIYIDNLEFIQIPE